MSSPSPSPSPSPHLTGLESPPSQYAPVAPLKHKASLISLSFRTTPSSSVIESVKKQTYESHTAGSPLRADSNRLALDSPTKTNQSSASIAVPTMAVFNHDTPAQFIRPLPCRSIQQSQARGPKGNDLPIFVYNSLVFPDVLANVIGDAKKERFPHKMTPASLPGYVSCVVRDADFPAAIYAGDARSRLIANLNCRDVPFFDAKYQARYIKRLDNKEWAIPGDLDVVETTANEKTALTLNPVVHGMLLCDLSESSVATIDRHMGWSDMSSRHGMFVKTRVMVETTVLTSDLGPPVDEQEACPTPQSPATIRAVSPPIVEDTIEEELTVYQQEMRRRRDAIIANVKRKVADKEAQDLAEHEKRMEKMDVVSGAMYEHDVQYKQFKEQKKRRNLTVSSAEKSDPALGTSWRSGESKAKRLFSGSRAISSRNSATRRWVEDVPVYASKDPKNVERSFSISTAGTAPSTPGSTDNLAFSKTFDGLLTEVTGAADTVMHSYSRPVFGSTRTLVDDEPLSPFPDFVDKGVQVSGSGQKNESGTADQEAPAATSCEPVMPGSGGDGAQPRDRAKSRPKKTKRVYVEAYTYLWSGSVAQLESPQVRPCRQNQCVMDGDTADVGRISQQVEELARETAELVSKKRSIQEARQFSEDEMVQRLFA